MSDATAKNQPADKTEKDVEESSERKETPDQTDSTITITNRSIMGVGNCDGAVIDANGDVQCSFDGDWGNNWNQDMSRLFIAHFTLQVRNCACENTNKWFWITFASFFFLNNKLNILFWASLHAWRVLWGRWCKILTKCTSGNKIQLYAGFSAANE